MLLPKGLCQLFFFLEFLEFFQEHKLLLPSKAKPERLGYLDQRQGSDGGGGESHLTDTSCSDQARPSQLGGSGAGGLEAGSM